MATNHQEFDTLFFEIQAPDSPTVSVILLTPLLNTLAGLIERLVPHSEYLKGRFQTLFKTKHRLLRNREVESQRSIHLLENALSLVRSETVGIGRGPLRRSPTLKVSHLASDRYIRLLKRKATSVGLRQRSRLLRLHSEKQG
jgi:hypothetical protein